MIAVRLCSIQIEHSYFKYCIRNKGLDPCLTRFAINKEKTERRSNDTKYLMQEYL